MSNRLAQSTSPYLLQHQDNPVDWWPWAPETFAEAKRLDKPILLSVGYAACHWCHVMAHESFEDENCARLMNELFINIKVDREERPDVDTIYQNALALLGQHGGWPLTMFLSPDGKPYWGGTYFPPRQSYGRPSFKDVLRRMAEVYHQEKDAVVKNQESILNALEQMAAIRPGGGFSIELLDQVAQRIVGFIDPVHGGLQGAPKFPQVSIFKLLWQAWARTKNQAFRDAVLLTLERISNGGIYDHLRGGYARYSTDELWLAPHFEKMLYDNAQILELLCWVQLDSPIPLWSQRAIETLEWLAAEMIGEGGGLAATLDADSEGVEGKFYVWDAAEIDDVLGADALLFKRVYDVSSHGNWEETNILNRLHPQLTTMTEDQILQDCRTKLLAVRNQRIRPGWDDKILADWNGLMIQALVKTASAFGLTQANEIALKAYQFVVDKMIHADHRLFHVYRGGQRHIDASLDDYAGMMGAAICVFEHSGAQKYLEQAEVWARILDQYYWDPVDGGYYFTASDAETLIVRSRHANDNATPSGNGVMADNLVRLFYLTGRPDYRAKAQKLFEVFSGALARNALAMPTLCNAFELLENAVHVTMVGDLNNLDSYLPAVKKMAGPLLILQPIDRNQKLPQDHPAADKLAINDSDSFYLCVGPVCQPPVTELEALSAVLERVRS